MRNANRRIRGWINEDTEPKWVTMPMGKMLEFPFIWQVPPSDKHRRIELEIKELDNGKR